MRSLVPHHRPLLAAGFGLVCLAGAAAAYLAIRAAEAEHMVAHALEVQGIATQLLSDLQDAETGQRGFLLTRAPAYLDPFKRAEADFPGALASLTRLTSDNARQQDRLTQLKPLIDAKLEELRRTIALAEQGQQDQAVDIVRSDRGRELMDRIRGYVRSISQEERDLLVLREADASLIRQWLLALIGVTLAAAVVLAGFLARAMQRGVERLRQRTKELEAEEKLRRETEETLRQAQKLEAIGQLTSGIAHDFNNLLTVITGNLEILQRRLRNTPPSQDPAGFAAAVGKPIDMALKGAASAAKLTHRLLAFSRRQMLNPVRLDLNRVVLDMSDLLRRTLGEAMSIETALAAGLWPTFADSNQIENTLLNLCINARDAMRQGGRLTIETANAHLDEDYTRQFGDVAPGQYVLLSVTDTGTGITPSDLPRIFEPFFTTKLKFELARRVRD